MKTKLFTFFILLVIFLLPSFSGHATTETNSDIDLIKRMENAFSSLTEKASKSVVFINVSKTVKNNEYFYLDPFEEFFGMRGMRERRRSVPKREAQGLGSGFIIDNKNGHVLTNNHVVGDADKIRVTTYDGKEYLAKVVGKDEKTDIAIIKVKDLPQELGEIQLADMNDVKVGNWAIAIGAPMGLSQTVTRGIVSAKGRGTLDIAGYGDFLQTDAAMNPGNSGGPLLNSSGLAIGMNTAIFSQSGGSQGTGFAIPSDILRDVSQKLINDGVVKRAFLGVIIQALTPEIASHFNIKESDGGVLVSNLEPQGPAEKAGIKGEDIIISINGKKVDQPDKLSYAVSMSPVGKKVPVEVIRSGKKMIFDVLLKYREDESHAPKNYETKDIAEFWGVHLSQSMVIKAIIPHSYASLAGLHEGDKIVEVNRHKVFNIEDFEKHANKESIFLKVERDNLYLFVMLRR